MISRSLMLVEFRSTGWRGRTGRWAMFGALVVGAFKILRRGYVVTELYGGPA